MRMQIDESSQQPLRTGKSSRLLRDDWSQFYLPTTHDVSMLFLSTAHIHKLQLDILYAVEFPAFEDIRMY